MNSLFRSYAPLRPGALALVLSGLAPAAFGQSFAPAVTYPAGNNSNPLSIAVADVSGDGRPDIVTANYGSSTVGLLLNKGAGTFQAVTNISAGANSQPSGVAVADVNADGKPDIITANQTASTAGVLLGTGNGTFAPVVAYSTGAGSQPSGLTVADVNGDGKLDILAANGFTFSLGVLLGNGNGTFQAPTNYATANSSPNSVTVGDVNADGKADVVTANVNGNAVGVLLGNGSGAFPTITTYATGPASGSSQPQTAALADVNADGKLDIITANSNANPSGTTGVLLGNGNGTFQAMVSYATGSNSIPNAAVVADVSGDGKPDIITANPGNYTAGVLVGKGNGTFQPTVTFAVDKNNGLPLSLAAVDVNADGKPDIITANIVTNTVSVLLNTATFLAARPATLAADFTLWPNPTAVAAPLSLAVASLPTEVRSLEATFFTALGQAVGHATVAVAQGATHAELPTAGLAAGTYLLHLKAHDARGEVVGMLPTQRVSVR